MGTCGAVQVCTGTHGDVQQLIPLHLTPPHRTHLTPLLPLDPTNLTPPHPRIFTAGSCSELTRYFKYLNSGGVREALFSDNCYNLLWAKRVGFAKVALEAKVVRNDAITFVNSQTGPDCSVCNNDFFRALFFVSSQSYPFSQ